MVDLDAFTYSTPEEQIAVLRRLRDCLWRFDFYEHERTPAMYILCSHTNVIITDLTYYIDLYDRQQLDEDTAWPPRQLARDLRDVIDRSLTWLLALDWGNNA